MSQQRSLQDWLSWQESLHFSAIDLGLDRVGEVARRMGLLKPDFPIITVAGTNGKGSTVALLSAFLDEAGYKVGAYTSPHILKYNERIALNRRPASDELICEAFAAIDAARGDISLTYFEFGTLAAIWAFVQSGVEIAVLEVGLGGRLDAANLWDADVAVITGIGIDHISWLGDDREVIGREKAGIARRQRPLVCGDPSPPVSIKAYAQELGAELIQYIDNFVIERSDETFNITLQQSSGIKKWENLPYPALLGEVQLQNTACALVALHQLAGKLMINKSHLHKGLRSVSLPGRLQKLQSEPDVYIDVAHNPHAARQLSHWLQKNPPDGVTYVLFSILSDKDIDGVIDVVRDVVDEWHFFPLQDSRAMALGDIQSAMDSGKVSVSISHEGLKQAWNTLKPRLKSQDRVVAFGSFLVVSSMLEDLF